MIEHLLTKTLYTRFQKLEAENMSKGWIRDLARNEAILDLIADTSKRLAAERQNPFVNFHLIPALTSDLALLLAARALL